MVLCSTVVRVAARGAEAERAAGGAARVRSSSGARPTLKSGLKVGAVVAEAVLGVAVGCTRCGRGRRRRMSWTEGGVRGPPHRRCSRSPTATTTTNKYYGCHPEASHYDYDYDTTGTPLQEQQPRRLRLIRLILPSCSPYGH